MTRILLVRHGQSEANLVRHFAGHFDPELTELGLRQAKLTAKFIFENYQVDKVYSSDLKRAYKTAKAVADLLKLEVIKSKALREIDGGKWENVSAYEVAEKFPNEYEIWSNDIGNSACPGGESARELSERVMKELYRIAEENPDSTVVVGTHATPIRLAQSVIELGDVVKAKDVQWASNASVTVFEYDGEFKVTAKSLDSHLGELVTKIGGREHV